jgi:cell division protein FtsZ
MTGAKGVIISIIGGEDMKLLEVDEAANHIRELVDPEANIIWGSAFNPSLEGKIRVSVVATGIEQNADQAQAAASQGFGFAGSRAQKKPVLPLPTEAELAEDAVSTSGAEASSYGQPLRFGEDEHGAGAESADAFASSPTPPAYDTDESQEDADTGLSEPDDDEAFGAGDEGYASLAGTRIERDPDAVAAGEEIGEGEEAGDEALELTFEAETGEPDGTEPAADELLLDASRLAEADEPVQGGRRRRILGSGAEESETPPPQRRSAPPSPPPGGSTLFERMANLSRASARREDEEEDEEDSGGSLRIPRFLGRQNNQ